MCIINGQKDEVGGRESLRSSEGRERSFLANFAGIEGIFGIGGRGMEDKIFSFIGMVFNNIVFFTVSDVITGEEGFGIEAAKDEGGSGGFGVGGNIGISGSESVARGDTDERRV